MRDRLRNEDIRKDPSFKENRNSIMWQGTEGSSILDWIRKIIFFGNRLKPKPCLAEKKSVVIIVCNGSKIHFHVGFYKNNTVF